MLQKGEPYMVVKKVTVLGANGSMGQNVSGIFAAFGDATVFMVARSKDKAEKAKENAALSVKAESILKRLIPCDYSQLKECISQSDLIFDSIVEDQDKKTELLSRISPWVKKDAIICTGTSGLSIAKLAQSVLPEQRARFVGLHMFNPPYTLNFCELIVTESTDAQIKVNMYNYAKDTLHRTVVCVKDRPAFLGNRVGFQMINNALQYAEKYQDNGGIDYIDAIIGPFTGRMMAPIETANFVGLDVHAAIVDNLYYNTNDYENETFKLPQYVRAIIQNGDLGKKTGQGLYRTLRDESGYRCREVFDIKSGQYRKVFAYTFPFKEKMISFIRDGNYKEAMETLKGNESQEARICLQFLLSYILYSLYVVEEVADTAHAVDDAMATGFNWVPPLGLIQALGGKEEVSDLIAKIAGQKDLPINAKIPLTDVVNSYYDYRKYFRAK